MHAGILRPHSMVSLILFFLFHFLLILTRILVPHISFRVRLYELKQMKQLFLCLYCMVEATLLFSHSVMRTLTSQNE